VQFLFFFTAGCLPYLISRINIPDQSGAIIAPGIVTFCRRERDSVYDFVIPAKVYTAVALLQRSRRLHGSIAEMEVHFAEHISRLRLVPQGRPGQWSSGPQTLTACSASSGSREPVLMSSAKWRADGRKRVNFSTQGVGKRMVPWSTPFQVESP
jgi:hypothetical protein